MSDFEVTFAEAAQINVEFSGADLVAGVVSIAGTANEITASASTGAVTLSLPSALTFTGKTVTGGTYSSPTLVTPALGTPASGTLTNCTGLPVASGISGFGIGIATALTVNVGSAGAPVLFNGAGGTPSSITLTNATGLPVSTGVSGLGTGVATALANALDAASGLQSFITAGTSAQYYRGDKTWATLNQAAVAGLTTADSPQFANLRLSDTNASHYLQLSAGSDLTQNRTLTLTTGDAARTLTLTGNATLNQDVSTTGTPTFASLSTGSGAISGGAISGTTGDFSSAVTLANNVAFRLKESGGTARNALLMNGSNVIQFGDVPNAGNSLEILSFGTINTKINTSTVTAVSSTGLAVTGTLGASGNVWSGNNNFSIGSGTTDGFYVTPAGTMFQSFNGSTADGQYLRRRVSDGIVTYYYRDTTQVGSISVTTTATAYNTSSDVRLKTNIRDLTNSGDIIDALKPRIFDWKSGASPDTYGFVAQETYAVFPQAVTKGDDDPDTITQQWAMDASKLVPVLTAELKSLRARVAALEAA